MVKGDRYWIIENGSYVTSVEVLSISGNLVLIRTKNEKTLRLPIHRLYDSEESAMEILHKRSPVQKKTPYDYMM